MRTHNYLLKELLKKSDLKTLVIPDFQRGFKWKASDVRKLLESLLLDYPIGAALLWETDSDELSYRLIENLDFDGQDNNDEDEILNIEASEKKEKILYILDGQQRITSIYNIFPKTLAPTRKEKNARLRGLRFFIDLKKLGLPGHYEDWITKEKVDLTAFYSFDDITKSIIAYDYTAMRRALRTIRDTVPQDLSDADIRELSMNKLILPLTRDFLEGSPAILSRIIRNATQKYEYLLIDKHGYDKENAKNKAEENILSWQDWFVRTFQINLTNNILACIILSNEKPEGLSRIFETINSTGLDLTVFDLLVARMSGWDNTTLRKIVKKECSKKNLELFDDPKSLGGTATQQLPRIFILVNSGKSLKKSEILGTGVQEFRNIAYKCCKGLNEGLGLLNQRFGVYNARFLPFKDAITLAGAFSSNAIDLEDNLKTKYLDIFEAYYWSVVFTEDLDRDTNSVTKRIHDELLKTMSDDKEADFILEKINSFPSFDELFIESSPSSMLYKGVLTFILSNSTKDWAGNDIKSQVNLEDHHIYPKDWIRNNIIPSTDAGYKNYSNSILNKVLVSKEANNLGAGAQAPYLYLTSDDYLENDRKNLCIPNNFTLNTEIPTTRYEYKEMLKLRYDLINDSVQKHIKKLIDKYKSY